MSRFETNAACRETIDIGRFDLRVTVTTDVTVQVIADQKEDVWWGSVDHRRVGGQRSKNQKSQKGGRAE
ncbi:hypothetical protein Pla52nx_001645 [Stieleria varia]|nr:hypothetical protein [Stieleria varia]